jgi:hypothetical protein
MNRVLIPFFLACFAMLSFASCTKFYSCECVDYNSKKTNHTVAAKSRNEANKSCAAIQTLGNCNLN